jgi:CelD/BcsL family acetyltransferase involved in cellulose biosynthesis
VAGDRVAFYQAGRLTDHDLRGSGSVLKAEVVRWAAATGHGEFDFLRGAESYKDDWASSSRWVRRVRVGVGLWGRTVCAWADTAHRYSPGAQRLLGRLIGEQRAEALTTWIVGLVRR